MGQNSPTAEEEAKTREAKLAFAVSSIARDENLRFFFREFLHTCSVLPPASVYDPDPRQNAYNQGFQAAGFELSQMLTSVDPLLWSTLLNEELKNET